MALLSNASPIPSHGTDQDSYRIMKILQLDHVAIHVEDVAISQNFYREILRLEELPRPDFDFPGAWFRLGDSQELHLIGERKLEVHSQRRGNHYALRIEDPDFWEAEFNSKDVEYVRKLRPDGAHQIFVQDPDGHWIELCSLD